MLRPLLVLLLIASATAVPASWVVSSAMAENWAFARVGTPEAVLDARAVLWLARILAPLLAVACWAALRRWQRTRHALQALASEMLRVVRVKTAAGGPAATIVMRGIIAAWLLLALVPWGSAARRLVHEWPVYRLRSGDQVLPNMSESNRDVIRYLAASTPEDARILAVSDQTLFFLSYYLWPREIMQRRHPESEFTVPQPGRQLAAFRLQDLSPDDIAAIDPDFVLEYFEGPEYVERDRLMDDPVWIAAVRQLHGDPSYVPPFNVRLRPIGAVQDRP